MRLLLAALVRLVALGAGMAAYYAALPVLFPGSTDANIGAGLLAFGGIVVASFGWAFADGRRRGASPTVATWAVVAVSFGVLWLLGLASLEADDSMTLVDRLRLDAFLAVFTAGLVLVPAALGAALGDRSRSSE
jgi:hypothetical protein